MVGSLFALTAVALLGAQGICEEAPRLEKEVPRFREVNPQLYRGGQPTRAGFRLLKQKGIKTVINLHRGRDEQELVEGLGLKYVYIPLSAWDRVSGQDIEKYFSVVDDPANQPVFVHCRRGADRTGFMIGLYRIARQGWSAEQAYREAREIGMHWWYRGLRNQLFEFTEEIAGAGLPNAGGRPRGD